VTENVFFKSAAKHKIFAHSNCFSFSWVRQNLFTSTVKVNLKLEIIGHKLMIKCEPRYIRINMVGVFLYGIIIP
jgi:hypothetical protein